MTYDEIIQNFRVSKHGKDYAQCYCPCHGGGNEKTPSLRITRGQSSDGKEKTLVHCYAGCDTESVMGSIGLEVKDLFVGKSENLKISGFKKYISYYKEKRGLNYIEHYEYVDEKGNYLYTKFRFFDPIKNGKTFTFGIIRDYDAEFSVKKENKVLYRLNEVRKAVEKNETIYVCEGEKDVHTIEELGLVATTSGGSSTWKDEFGKCFENANVVVFQDNDTAGDKYKQNVLKSIRSYAKSVTPCTPCCNIEHGDVTDYLEAGYTLKELLEEVKKARERMKPKRVNKFIPLLDSIELFPIIKPDFLVDRLIYKNGINLISGDPKTFKTYIAIDIALSVAVGGSAFESFEVKETGKVLFISPEFDTRDRTIMLARSIRRDIELSKVNNMIIPMPDELELFNWSEYREFIVNAIEEHKPVLVVLDPLTYIYDKDISKNDEVREFFVDLKNIMKQFGTTIIITHHNNRMNNDKKMNNVSGAAAITRFSDAIIYLERFKEEEEQDINKSDDELDVQEKEIKLIKGVYRHGGEGYKYHKISFSFTPDVMTEISSERYDNREEEPVNRPRSETKKTIVDEIMTLYELGKIGTSFKADDVLKASPIGVGYTPATWEKYIRQTLSEMTKKKLIRSVRGQGYSFNMLV